MKGAHGFECDHVVFGRLVKELGGLVLVCADWLFDQHVLARANASERLAVVNGVGGAYVYGVDVR